MISVSTMHGRNAEGFTLFEMLVTIMLLSLLSLLLFGGLRFGARAWDGSQAHGAGTDEMRVVQGLLRREIEQAYPYYDTTDSVHPAVDFHGGEGAMTFLAPAPQAAESSGRDRITVSRELVKGRMQLVMRAAPELAASSESDWATPLLQNLAAVRFSYFGADGGWHGQWADAATAPSLVRVHIEFPRGDGRIWPDLIVAPHIEADAGCVYDVAAKHCVGRP